MVSPSGRLVKGAAAGGGDGEEATEHRYRLSQCFACSSPALAYTILPQNSPLSSFLLPLTLYSYRAGKGANDVQPADGPEKCGQMFTRNEREKGQQRMGNDT